MTGMNSVGLEPCRVVGHPAWFAFDWLIVNTLMKLLYVENFVKQVATILT